MSRLSAMAARAVRLAMPVLLLASWTGGSPQLAQASSCTVTATAYNWGGGMGFSGNGTAPDIDELDMDVYFTAGGPGYFTGSTDPFTLSNSGHYEADSPNNGSSGFGLAGSTLGTGGSFQQISIMVSGRVGGFIQCTDSKTFSIGSSGGSGGSSIPLSVSLSPNHDISHPIAIAPGSPAQVTYTATPADGVSGATYDYYFYCDRNDGSTDTSVPDGLAGGAQPPQALGVSSSTTAYQFVCTFPWKGTNASGVPLSYYPKVIVKRAGESAQTVNAEAVFKPEVSLRVNYTTTQQVWATDSGPTVTMADGSYVYLEYNSADSSTGALRYYLSTKKPTDAFDPTSYVAYSNIAGTSYNHYFNLGNCQHSPSGGDPKSSANADYCPKETLSIDTAKVPNGPQTFYAYASAGSPANDGGSEIPVWAAPTSYVTIVVQPGPPKPVITSFNVKDHNTGATYSYDPVNPSAPANLSVGQGDQIDVTSWFASGNPVDMKIGFEDPVGTLSTQGFVFSSDPGSRYRCSSAADCGYDTDASATPGTRKLCLTALGDGTYPDAKQCVNVTIAALDPKFSIADSANGANPTDSQGPVTVTRSLSSSSSQFFSWQVGSGYSSATIESDKGMAVTPLSPLSCSWGAACASTIQDAPGAGTTTYTLRATPSGPDSQYVTQIKVTVDSGSVSPSGGPSGSPGGPSSTVYCSGQ